MPPGPAGRSFLSLFDTAVCVKSQLCGRYSYCRFLRPRPTVDTATSDRARNAEAARDGGGKLCPLPASRSVARLC